MPKFPPLTPEQRSQRASIAAHARWAREDPVPAAINGQAALRARFDREAREAEPGLPDAEYARRAESAYRAHMGRLALASSRARGARARGQAAVPDETGSAPGSSALRSRSSSNA